MISLEHRVPVTPVMLIDYEGTSDWPEYEEPTTDERFEERIMSKSALDLPYYTSLVS